MRLRVSSVYAGLLAATLLTMTTGSRAADVTPGEWQHTFTPIAKNLDNNDNFSPDGRFLIYDTRDTVGTGIGNSTSIMKVSITTALENYVYAPAPVLYGAQSAPGLGAASYSPIADDVVYIHGPLVSETPELGFYGTTNRRAGLSPADGSGDVRFLDCRDVFSDTTPPGAHRGGSHRHEFSADGKRVGFTYDDRLLTQYGRTIGYMVLHEKAPCGVSHWTALLVPVVPAGTSRPGELERAADDSWVGAKGLMRAFIGNVKELDGSLMSSLFVVDIPENIDITSADSGTKTRYPAPPKGITIRRLTSTPASGIVRGSLDGTRIAYYATGSDGKRQVFIINSLGSDQHPDAAMRPTQVTQLAGGASGGLRWHPSGNSIAVLSDNGVVTVCVKPGPSFGRTLWLTTNGPQLPAAEALVWSRDGRMLAFNRRVPTYDPTGRLLKDAGGNDFRQIFLVAFPDTDGDGVADPIQ